ncbi:hypothetical protein K6U29_03405 [Vibrio parahaemolyticus]|nr:hypothetical protein [Vibrio parahaemolyticus]
MLCGGLGIALLTP